VKFHVTTTEVASVIADLDTRCRELYASGGEVLPAGKVDIEAATEAASGSGVRASPGEPAGGAFVHSPERAVST
jgi:hypothetical protein